jgi:hypothetical protein
MPYCSDCGKPIVADDKFCPYCGQSTGFVKSSTETEATTPPSVAPPTVSAPQQATAPIPPTVQKPAPPVIEPPSIQRAVVKKAEPNQYQPAWVKEGIRGTVRALEKDVVIDKKKGNVREIAFRLQIIDQSGNEVEIIPVQALVCYKHSASLLNNGEIAVVKGYTDPGGLFIATGLYNESTDFEFKLMPRISRLVTWGPVASGVFFIFFGFFVISKQASYLDLALLFWIVGVVFIIIGIYFNRKGKC